MFTDNIKLAITRCIHWTMAVLIIGLITLGFYMTTTESFNLYSLHKSFGVLALCFLVFRFIWRTINPWQSSARNTPQERLVAIAHRSLLALLLLMPVSGFFISGFGGYGVALFGLQIIPSNFNENGEAVAISETLAELGYLTHEVIAYLFSALIAGHIAAAIKHHFVNEDNTLKRMLGLST